MGLRARRRSGPGDWLEAVQQAAADLDDDQRRDVIVALGRARAGKGAWMLAAPGWSARRASGAQAGPGASVAWRMRGARDLSLGLGTAIAARRGGGVRGWVEAGALVDGLDAATALTSRGLRRGARAWLLLGGTAGALAGWVLARELD